MRRIFVTVCVLITMTISAFADETQYKKLLEEAKNYEANKQWVYAMGTYWDACSVYPEGAKEAYDGFYRIAEGFNDEGNPGPGEYDIFTCYDGWIKVCKEFEIYWNEHSDEILYVPEIKCEKGEADMKNRTVTYNFNASLEKTPKFSIIWNYINDSFKEAYKDNWDEIPVQWPAVSMFKDSKTIPVVKFISLFYKQPWDFKLYICDFDEYVIVGNHYNEELFFPSKNIKSYYVAAWNNKCSLTLDGTPISNREIKIKIKDNNGSVICSGTSSNNNVKISGITSDVMKIIDSGEWTYEVESIVVESKSEEDYIIFASKRYSNRTYERGTSETFRHDLSDWIDIEYSAGPVINMYKEGKHNNALIEVNASPLVKTMFATGKVEKDINKIQIRTSNVRNDYSNETTKVLSTKDEVFIMPCSNTEAWYDKYGSYIPTTIDGYGADDILELMNKMYDSKFYLGYTPYTKKDCICCILTDKIKTELESTKAELEAELEAKKAQKKEAEEKQIINEFLKKYPYLNSYLNSDLANKNFEINLEDFPTLVSYINMMIKEKEDSSLRDEVFNIKIVCNNGFKKTQIASMLASLGEAVRNADFYINLESSWCTEGIDCLYLKNCNKLVELTALHAAIIPENAFSGCTSLKKLSIFGADYIGKNAFSDCPALKQLVLFDDIINIDRNAFDGCEQIEYIRVPKKFKKILKENYKDLIKAGVMRFW